VTDAAVPVIRVAGVAGVLIHVADPPAAVAWYARAFPQSRPTVLENGFEVLTLGSVQLEIVPADAKVGSGPGGSVVYWLVEDFERALAHMTSVGATLYRGPMKIEHGMSMCQVRDPWGNCIGLRGPSRS
jgi:predicted enzyme related to lactoylglutathione lyase